MSALTLSVINAVACDSSFKVTLLFIESRLLFLSDLTKQNIIYVLT